MAGLVLDRPKVISARTHAVIDYVHVATNFLVGALLRKRDRRASNAAFALGASVLVNSLMTDYPLGVFRIYSFKMHGVMDYGVAAASAVIPSLLDIDDPAAARYFQMQGGGEFLIAGMSDYSDETGSRRAVRGRRFGRAA